MPDTTAPLTDGDKLYAQAVEAVRAENKASTSFVQRKLQIGYNSAAALMERMEAEGIISAANPVGKHDVNYGDHGHLNPVSRIPEGTTISVNGGPEYKLGSPEAFAAVGEVVEAGVKAVRAARAEPSSLDKALVEQYCLTALNHATKLNRPFTVKDIVTGCYFSVDLAHSVLSLLQSAGIVTRADAKGLRQVISDPDTLKANFEAAYSKPPAEDAIDKMAAAQVEEKAPLFQSDDIITGAAQTRLRTIIERIERLEEDKAGIAGDIAEVYDEAKGEGFDVKILRKVVSLRKKDKVKRDEEETILDLYLTAIGDR